MTNRADRLRTRPLPLAAYEVATYSRPFPLAGLVRLFLAGAVFFGLLGFGLMMWWTA